MGSRRLRPVMRATSRPFQTRKHIHLRGSGGQALEQGRKDTEDRDSIYVEQKMRQEGHAGMAAVTGAAGLDSRGQRALRQTSGDKAGHAGQDMA